jgi:hypothetical protein
MGKRVVALIVVLAAVLALAFAVTRLQRLPSGPVPIAWDKEPCAHCRMLVGEPAFAAQIQTRDRRVLDFDDPGCLFAYEAAHHPDEHAVWFHEHGGDRWLPRERTAFLPVPRSPMGYGLGAVEVGTPGAIPFDVARERVLSRRAPTAVSEPGAHP